MKRKFKSANRKAFVVLTGGQALRESENSVVLFKSHFCIISRGGGKTWHAVSSNAGTAA
jgi:hypothetical protein